MKKIRYIFIFLMTLLIIFISNTLKEHDDKDINLDKVYKVAFYNHYPYYYLNDKLEPTGYYHELMELISKKINIKYEYVNLDLSQCIDSLENETVDLVFGATKNAKREKEFAFSKYSVARENVSVYTKKYIENENLKALQGLKFGYMDKESNNEFFMEIINKRNIDVDIVKYNSYEELKTGFMKNEVESIVYLSSDRDLSKYNKIFNFSIGELYLASTMNNRDVIDKIDFVLKDKNTYYISKLYDKYFNENLHRNRNMVVLLFTVSFIAVSIIGVKIYEYFDAKNKFIKIKNKILLDLQQDNYMLYYQPIINPKTNTVKCFEGLLRLKDKNKIVSPYLFLKDIEKTDMMSEVSLWVLRRAIKDYHTIKNFDCVKGKDFYISINLSFKEIEDKEFIEEVNNIFRKSNLRPGTICLEIVEKFAINDLKIIQESIYKLKEVGFIVAIDDFGVEYSNLDILEKIDCDIVKLDKYFMDDIKDSFIRKEIVSFISNVCKYTNKTLVCEGVETRYQEEIIKNIDNNKFYIQGYYYSKPLNIENLRVFKVK